MSGLSVSDLGWPSDRYRVDLHDPEFETFSEAEEEDRKRATALRNEGSKRSTTWRRVAVELANRLDPANGAEPPESPASSRHMREQRIRIIGEIWRLLEEDSTGQQVRFDVVKPGWHCSYREFSAHSPARLLEQLRADIIRSGVRRDSGFLFAGYHNEFEPIELEFSPHVHVLATGSYVDAIDALRRSKGYARTARVRTPVRAKRSITDPAHALTYLLKSYWLQRPFLPLGANGDAKRPRSGQRIDEPYHSEVLLWLDQIHLRDLILLMGIRIGRKGLVLTRP